MTVSAHALACPCMAFSCLILACPWRCLCCPCKLPLCTSLCVVRCLCRPCVPSHRLCLMVPVPKLCVTAWSSCNIHARATRHVHSSVMPKHYTSCQPAVTRAPTPRSSPPDCLHLSPTFCSFPSRSRCATIRAPSPVCLMRPMLRCCRRAAAYRADRREERISLGAHQARV